jgi:hypothetical protein
MNEKDKKELIAHILEQSRGQELPTKADDFDSLLFEERVRLFLMKEFMNGSPQGVKQ